jgi:hypothetical protein
MAELAMEESGRLMHGCLASADASHDACRMLGSQPLESDALRLARQFACSPGGCREARPLCAVQALHDRAGTA